MVKKITIIRIIQQFLYDYGRRYYLRELAASLGKPHQTLKPYLKELVNLGVLVEAKRRNLNEYQLNFNDKRVYDCLVIAEKEKLLEKLQEEPYLRTLFEKLSVSFDKNTFIIFGSAVDRIQKGSDIDLFIIGKQHISKHIKDFEDIYTKKIHKVQVKTLEKLNMSFVKEVYKKHLIFNNTEIVIRFFGGLHEENKLV